MDVTTLATRTPVEIDTEIADRWAARATASRTIAHLVDHLHEGVGDKRQGPGRFPKGPWTLTEAECRDRVDTAPAYLGLDRTLADLHTARAEWSRQSAAIQSLEVEHDLRGWSRFFLVTSSAGHIHSSMSCATCYPSTEFGWLPQLSGLDEAAAVADQGEILCSVCFPTAPVGWTNGTSRASQTERDARAAAKAERDAKRAAKALLPDGTDLVVEIELAVEGGGTRIRQERFATLHAAKGWLTDAYQWSNAHAWYPEHACQTVAQAIANKTGDTVAQVIEAARKRAAKR